MSTADEHRILIIGDSYMTPAVFERSFQDAGLRWADSAQITIVDRPRWAVDGLREYEGDPAEVDALIDGHTVLAVHGAPITREVLERNPSVRIIGCARGGPVNIDLEAARELGVTVTTTPGKNAEAVAELTIGFVISLARNVRPSVREVDEIAAAGGAIAESAFEGAQWFGRELRGRRLGLIGLGNVARLVAQRANALGIEVLAYDPYLPAEVEVAGVRRITELEELYASVDMLSLHARATAENRGMIGEAALAALPDGALLVNTARESLVDEAALLAALRSGRIAGAAMDVCEPDGPWRELLRERNVIITPHIAGASYETLRRGADMLVSEIGHWLRGEELRWSVA